MANTKITSSENIEKRFSFLRTALSVLIALVIAFLLILTVSEDPVNDMITFLIGPLTSVSRISTIVEKLIPLLFTGTAVCLMFSAGQINLSAEGAFFAGAIASTAIAMIKGIPIGIHFVLCFLAGGLAGAIISGLPGIMHVKFKVMTVVSSLMLNYVALFLGLYVLLNIYRDPTAGFEASYPFAESAKLPIIIPNTDIHLGLIIGIAVVIFGSVLLHKTTFGYGIRTIGQNQKFAFYSGIPVGKTIILTQVIAGFLAGAGGSVEILGLYNRLAYSGFTGHGWDGIMIAVVARNNPKNVPFAVLFVAYIRTAADVLSRMSKVPNEVVDIIQAVIIVFIAAEAFLSQWEHRAIVKNSQLVTAQEQGS